MSKKRSNPVRNDRDLHQSDIDNERMGRNSLQGDDQQNVRNERQAMPEERQGTDGLRESFRKLDKDVRARTDLNKGATRRR